jgi:hypothetical protein
MNVTALEEFQYEYGDPRVHFLRYLEKFPNVEVCWPNWKKERSHYTDVKPQDMFRFACDHSKRKFMPPNDSAIKKLQQGNKPIVLIPIFMRNKYKCSYADASKHINILLYNRLTKELDRIDIKKYHLDGFNLKILLKKITETFMPKYLPEAKLSEELDVPLTFVKKHKFAKSSDAFPMWLLSYIIIRSAKPELSSQNVVTLLNRQKTQKILDQWKQYVTYRHGIANKCQRGTTENPTSGKCVLPTSQALVSKAVNKAPKKCKQGQEFNNLMQKCVKEGTLTDVDVLLEDVMKVNLSKQKEFVSLDKDAKLIIGAMNFILRKYPYARFIAPTSSKKLKKLDVKISWAYIPSKSTFRLKIPDGFWDTWARGMEDASIRFLIVFIGLVSKGEPPGHHANVLIYDKSTDEMERFDGLGRDLHEYYNIDEFDKLISKEFADRAKSLYNRDMKYFSPMDYCPKMPIFQSKEIDEIPGKDLHGNCAVWRMWYVNLRLANPDINRKDLVIMAHNKLMQTGSLYRFIKSYQVYLSQSYKKLKRT